MEKKIWKKFCSTTFFRIFFFCILGMSMPMISKPCESICSLHEKDTIPVRYTKRILKDGYLIIKNIFDPDTFKVIVGTIPFYIAASMMDEKLHHCFYIREKHKNVCQLDPFFCGFAQYGFTFPVFFASALSIAARDERLRHTSRIFMVGVPLVFFTSDLIKQSVFIPAAFRPWHEDFHRHKRSFRGFPSGHMALVSYAAFTYGLQMGPKYAVPLGLLATFVGASFINCNRHYLSQIIAGAGVGAVFAFATSKAVDQKLACLNKNINVGASVDAKGCPALSVSFQF